MLDRYAPSMLNSIMSIMSILYSVMYVKSATQTGKWHRFREGDPPDLPREPISSRPKSADQPKSERPLELKSIEKKKRTLTLHLHLLYYYYILSVLTTNSFCSTRASLLCCSSVSSPNTIAHHARRR